MKDQNKTKGQLIGELGELHQLIAELEAVEAEHRRAGEALRKSEGKRQKVEVKETASSGRKRYDEKAICHPR
jgi:antirestriction protein